MFFAIIHTTMIIAMTKKEKSYIRWFAVLLAVMIGVISWLIQPHGYTCYDIANISRIVKDAAKEDADTLQVFFMGDSEAKYAFSPLQLYKQSGVTSYNFSSRAQRLYDTYELLQLELQRQHPSLVILEANSFFRKPAMSDQDNLLENQLILNLPLLRYHNFYKASDHPRWLTKKMSSHRKFYKGFAAVYGIRPYKNAYSEKGKNSPSVFYTENQEAADRIVSLCKERQITLVIVSVPAPLNWNDKKAQLVAQWCKERDLKYLDLNQDIQAIGLNWKKDTQDGGDHLNIYGSQKVMNYLEMNLFARMHLADMRGDECIAPKWNQAVEDSGLYQEKK